MSGLHLQSHGFASAAILFCVIATLATPASAVTAKLQIVLDLPAGAAQRTVSYRCENADPLSVTYIDAAPNFLAIVPHEGNDLIFVGIPGKTGAQYVSGSLVWTADADKGRLTDLVSGADSDPLLDCTQSNDTP